MSLLTGLLRKERRVCAGWSTIQRLFHSSVANWGKRRCVQRLKCDTALVSLIGDLFRKRETLFHVTWSMAERLIQCLAIYSGKGRALRIWNHSSLLVLCCWGSVICNMNRFILQYRLSKITVSVASVGKSSSIVLQRIVWCKRQRVVCESVKFPTPCRLAPRISETQSK